jgi:hypothetical protein
MDFRNALLCSVIVNVAPFVKRRKSYEPADFMPRALKNHRPQTLEEMAERARLINAQVGGEFIVRDS